MSVTLPSAIRAFLDERRFATLATIAEDGTPQLTVMWYLRRGDTIIVNTEAGRRKDRHLRRDQRVAFGVEDQYQTQKEFCSAFHRLTGQTKSLDAH